MPSECEANPLQRGLADAIIRIHSLDELRILFACGAKVNDPVTQGLRPLHYAVWQKYTLAVNLLIVRGADVNATDDCGYSPLHLAAEHGYLELTELLLEHDAKVDYREPTDDLFPRTTLCDEPLRLALRNKHYDVARLLLEHGADPNKKYFFGSEINLETDYEALELLLTFGANPDSRDRTGMTPLMKAARMRQGLQNVLLLLSYGADINAISDRRNGYQTVLHCAVASGNIVIVNLLLKQGAKVDLLPPYPEPDTSSPLHLAIIKGDPALVKILLENGASVNRCSPVIGSPLHVACADNIPHRFDIMKMLLFYGADPNIQVPADPGSNLTLRPALAELLASNENVLLSELHLLLRYGAKVVMKTQYRDPDGLLNCLKNIDGDSKQFNVLLEAAEEFDPCMIRRNTYLSAKQKELLVEKSSIPLSLKFQSRMFLRRRFGRDLPEIVSKLEIPLMLQKYVLYLHS